MTTIAIEKVTKPIDQLTNPRQDGGGDRQAPLWPRSGQRLRLASSIVAEMEAEIEFHSL